MKNSQTTYKSLALLLISILFLISNVVVAQDEQQTEEKKSDSFIIYGGVSFNNLAGTTDKYESILTPGYLLGVSYKRGRFFYWQVGARFSQSLFELNNSSIHENAPKTSGSFSVSELDIPVTGGINVLWFTDRVVALRFFIGAVPAFALGVGSNDLGITKDDVNTFNLYGQGGIFMDRRII